MDGWETRSLFCDPKHPVAGRLQRLCVCSAIVACTEIIPAFVAPPHPIIFPLHNGKMLTLSFAHFPAHS